MCIPYTVNLYGIIDVYSALTRIGNGINAEILILFTIKCLIIIIRSFIRQLVIGILRVLG